VSYETIRIWAAKFGPVIASKLDRKPARPDDIWHLDEAVIAIAGETRWLWRAVDQVGIVLDEIVQKRRNKAAAVQLLKRLLKKQGLAPKRIITDKLGSYGAAKKVVMPGVEHGAHKGLNNRAENSHLPIRKREKLMLGFRSWGGLQRFTTVFSAIRNLIVTIRANRSAAAIKTHRQAAFQAWNAAAGIAA
jgi:putative transposase